MEAKVGDENNDMTGSGEEGNKRHRGKKGSEREREGKGHGQKGREI